MAELPGLRSPRRRIGSRDFDFDRQVAVMAIVNRTPDSFYDAGATLDVEHAVAASLQAVADGADWVDIGGVAFSPDTPEVGVGEELDRVVPVVAALAGRSDVVISVDTSRPQVAAAALAAGADVVNDTSGAGDPAMIELLATSSAHIVVAHSLAAPHRHHPSPQYADVVAEVVAFLTERVQRLEAAGVGPERIVIDPGPDLNKNPRHTLELMRRLDEITALGLPTLLAVSNKDFIGETLDRGRTSRLPGSLAATAWAVGRGARVVRTHNVAATVDAVRMTEAVLGLREPAYLRHNV